MFPVRAPHGLIPPSGPVGSPRMGTQVSEAGRLPRLSGSRNANADWMSALCPRLWDVPLHHLSIPGEACASPAGMWAAGRFWEWGKPRVSHACTHTCTPMQACTHTHAHTLTHTLTLTLHTHTHTRDAHTCTYVLPRSHMRPHTLSQSRTHTSMSAAILCFILIWPGKHTVTPRRLSWGDTTVWGIRGAASASLSLLRGKHRELQAPHPVSTSRPGHAVRLLRLAPGGFKVGSDTEGGLTTWFRNFLIRLKNH